MIIINPTEEKVSILIEGATYSVEARGEVEVSKEVAAKWAKTHGFLQLEESKAKPASKKEEKEEVADAKEEVKEEKAEEVKEEKPKKESKAKSSK